MAVRFGDKGFALKQREISFNPRPTFSSVFFISPFRYSMYSTQRTKTPSVVFLLLRVAILLRAEPKSAQATRQVVTQDWKDAAGNSLGRFALEVDVQVAEVVGQVVAKQR